MLAEESSIHSSEVPDIDETPSAFSINSPLWVFVIETTWLAGPAAPDDLRGAGASGAGWCPFPSQEQPLAQLAGRFAQRADFQAEFCALTTVSDPGTRKPGVILIDPEFIADEDGRRALESAVRQLPNWVMPLAILGRPDDSRTRDLARWVMELLSVAEALSPTATSLRAAQGVSSLSEFNAIIRSSSGMPSGSATDTVAAGYDHSRCPVSPASLVHRRVSRARHQMSQLQHAIRWGDTSDARRGE